MKSKPIQDQSKVKDQSRIEKAKKVGKNRGIAQKPIDEPLPRLEKSQVEKVITGDNNSFVILGRDRPGNLFSGFGGKGATQAARIDLIAGLSSGFTHPDGTVSPPDKDTIVNPNFAIDAARVYISQKAHLDRYMGLAEVSGQSPSGRSGIGLKADAIRIHSRNDIKIVTGRAKFEGTGPSGEKLSNGGKNEVVGTISLIAGNNTDKEDRRYLDMLRPFGRKQDSRNKLQPIPKGESLSECIEDIVKAIQELSALVGDNISMIQTMELHLSQHSHVAPSGPTSTPVGTYPIMVTPRIQTGAIESIQSRELLNKNLGLIKFNYLSKYGSDYINSKYVFTT